MLRTYFQPLSRLVIPLLGTAFVTGCASQAILIGETPTDPPPRVVFLGARDASGHDYLAWENVSSFGRVPAAFKPVGDVSCMKIGINMRATGYHPKALDRFGQVMPGGGFYCQLSNLAGVYSSEAPRLIRLDGQLVWDKPGSFGAVPANMIEKGKIQCSQQGSPMKLLGYHPGALNLDGQQIVGGGFLCVN
jgi:hypothetical protein